jgi:hypothetical protein
LPAPLIIGAGTQKDRGACPQKAAPEQVRVSFCGHPVLFFRGCACRNPSGAGNKPEFGNIRFLI